MPPKKNAKDTKAASGKGGKGGDPKGGKADAKEKGGKEKGAQSINVRHILVDKHSTALEAIAKLEAGTKFDAVAREMSSDKARAGGSLGWKIKGSMVPEFEAVAFGLAVSTVDKPVYNREPLKTGFGYHSKSACNCL